MVVEPLPVHSAPLISLYHLRPISLDAIQANPLGPWPGRSGRGCEALQSSSCGDERRSSSLQARQRRERREGGSSSLGDLRRWRCRMIEACWWMSRRGHRRRKLRGGIRLWCMERRARGLLLDRTCRIEGGDVIMDMTWPLI